MRHDDILVIGGSGFVGRHLVAALAARGARVTVPTRRRERAKHLLLLPTVDVVESEVGRPGELERLAAGRNAVVNLVGVLHSRRGRRDERGPNDYGPDFARAHVELAQAVVNACRAAGVKRLLHMSALGADPQGPSEYLRSKGIGERAALAAEDLAVTVFQPSVIFGPEDAFLNLFAQLARFLPVLALACPEARFQPVYVVDVARAFVAALDAQEASGRRYGLCGPRQYTLRELVQTVCRLTGRRRLVLGLGDRLSYAQARLMELLPVKLMTRDTYYSMQVSSVCDGAFPFGIEPAALEAVAPLWLAGGGRHGRYPGLRAHAGR
ncbi:MAG: complex I NDUFA9 subunit family protein [Betaproteobacteria bacterium]|nr:complex I NDUFA9 subunit family protein [Betaproteobacteria bacterium]